MFQHLNNIETAFKHVRLFTLVVVIVCAALCGFTIFYCMSRLSQATDKIYVLADGKAYSAGISTRTDNLPVEARDHVSRFHELFFTLSPDEKSIEARAASAFYMADRSAKDAYDALKENGYYAAVIAGNVSQELKVDSVQVNTATYPYYFRFFGRQRIIRTSVILTRSLVTEGYLRDIDRSDHNSHGLLIERWVTIDNRDILTEKR